MAEGSPSTSRRFAGIALTLVLLGGTFYLMSRTAPPPGPPPGEAAKPATTAAAPAEAPPAPAPDAAKPAQAATEAAPAAAPGFDLVRVEPDGSTAVAGTAEPGSKVTILADSAPVAEVETDAAGNFVALFRVEPSAAPRALTLEAAPAGGGPAASSADVVMLLPQAPAGAGAEAPPAAAGGPAVPEPGQAASGPTDISTPPPPAAATAPAVAATAIIRGDTVEVMPTEGSLKGLTLASISYSQGGDVTLAGRARAGSTLRAYVDNRFAEEAQAGRDGRWSMDLGGVAGGIYKLRIDELGADGKVADRVETPFQRDYPHPPPPRPGVAAGVAGAVAVTVQPGNSLWTLARTRYGSGAMYTQIFTANREQIRDPNLIYPGQILNVPGQQAVE